MGIISKGVKITKLGCSSFNCANVNINFGFLILNRLKVKWVLTKPVGYF